MKLHAIILRILIGLGVIAYIAATVWEADSLTNLTASLGFFAAEGVCVMLLFLPFSAPRLLGAGGLFCDMLGNSLYSLHEMTGFYPAGMMTTESSLLQMLHAFLGLLLAAACVAVVIWEVHRLKQPPPPVDAEEPEFTQPGAWDQGRGQ